MIERSPVHSLLAQWLEAGVVKCVSLLVLQGGEEALRIQGGLARFTDGETEVDDQHLFTIASPTKPVTAACFMQFVEEGYVSLQEPVAAHLPEFGANGKGEVTFFHLLTHTSGLPEQAPGKDELRRREADLDEFFERTCAAAPLFAPGTAYQYSNLGFLLLARVVEKVERRPFGEVLAERILQPLGMANTALGVDPSWDERIVEIELPVGKEEERAFVNSRYWRGMGAPWGAMVSCADDLAAFCEAFRNGGVLGEESILCPATVDAMVTDRLPDLPAYANRSDYARQGLSWKLQGYTAASFGDLASFDTFGHYGATGTLVWVDPVNEITFVFLGNREGGLGAAQYARLANAVVATVTG